MSPPRPLPPDIDIDSNSFCGDEDTASLSFGHIFQPQPVRATPGSLVWGTEPEDTSFGATYFPGPDNSLGLFTTDPQYLATAASALPQGSPTPPPRLEIQGYEIEGGWTFDALGQTHYVPHGRIEDVPEDVDANDLPLIENSSTFFHEQLPATTTPPPRPQQRPIQLIPLDRLPLGDWSNTYTRSGPLPPSPQYHDDDDDFFNSRYESNDRSATPSTCSSPTILLTHSQELTLVEQLLTSIRGAFADIMTLHAKFDALPESRAADLCSTVSEALHVVQASLKRHRAVVPEQWRLRTVSCQRKYNYRLTSLKKTLHRLHTLSTASPRVTHAAIDKFCTLLTQHHAKLSDLALKFHATFDRLHDRHWNAWLSGVRTDLYCRVEARRTARAARVAMGPYGRRPSLVVVEVV
ncbi:hypothetical protein C8R46DRAFT_1184236 [Mycena filopes]|nr:hypothetical protein C8R46DRAFT_1184236 [Mycena filopes]